MNHINLFAIALVIRIIAIVYGEWQDANFALKYTDVDYRVFSDAAGFVVEGGSPYDRATYRYTPLLAWMMIPNILVHPGFGKVLFAVTDLVCGLLISDILKLRGVSSRWIWWALVSWLFNPIGINISTRGNAESLIAFMVLATVWLVLSRRVVLGGLMYGLAVHFKIYPVLFAPAFVLFMGHHYAQGKGRERSLDRRIALGLEKYAEPLSKRELQENKKSKMLSANVSPLSRVRAGILHIATPDRLKFGFAALFIFVFLMGGFYVLYGEEFLDETYFYHIRRADHRHNFSVYFYQLYLETGVANIGTGISSLMFDGLELGDLGPSMGQFLALGAFVPQFLLVILLGVVFHRNIEFCVMIQTLAFVALNKVCTVQYFLWYLSILPLSLPALRLRSRPWKSIVMVSLWQGAQLLWLLFGYKLEFLGENVFTGIWISGLVFFFVNMWVLAELIWNFDGAPTYSEGKRMPLL